MLKKGITTMIAAALLISAYIPCYAEDFVQLSESSFITDDKYTKENRVTANFVQEVWPQEIDTISAEITAEFYDKDRNICCILALYNAEGKLVSVETENRNVFANGVQEFQIECENAKNADTAKLMVWDMDSLEPLRQEKTLEKIKNAQTIFLDPVNGNDANDGSFDKPYQTLLEASKAVRRKKYDLGPNDDKIYVILKNGEYFMDSELALGTSGGGNEDYSVIYTALETHKAVLTGAVDIDGFTLWDESKNIYRAEVGTEIDSRQLFANGIRCVRARRDELPEGFSFQDGVMTAAETEFLNFKHIEDLEFSFEVHWMHDRCRVDSIDDMGDGRIRFNMREPVWKQMISKKYFDSTGPTYMENAYEFIDEGGEWYLDTHEGYLYYKPRSFEDMETTRFTMPVTENFITISSSSSPVKNIDFRGIEFTQSTWMYPTTNGGLCINQNESYRIGSGTDTAFMEGVVKLNNIDNINFYNCKFSKLGRTALKMVNGVKNCNIIGNEFCDLSAGALSVGGVSEFEENPDNVSLLVENVKVENNFIHGIAVDIKSSAAVSAGFPTFTRIGNNEIYDTGYSGMHTGWGWGETLTSPTKNFEISNNYIHRILNDKIYDGGAVYMLGGTGGTSDNLNKLTENYVEDIRMPFGALYPDEGSSYWEISNNVVDLSKQPVWYPDGNPIASRWTHIHINTINHIVYGTNYSTTSNHENSGTDISYQAPQVYRDANWPTAALDIIERSGIEPEYEDNFPKRLEEFYDSGEIAVHAGDEVPLYVTPTTSKGKYYNADKFDCYASISDDGVLEVRDGKIYALEKGVTEIKLTAVENNMIKEHTLKIVVN